jgi:hypothetical protein
VSAQLVVERGVFELPSLIKFGRALSNTLVTSCVWLFRVIITWVSPAPSVANVITAFAFAAVTKIKGMHNREAGEPTERPSPDEGKLAAVAMWKK